MATGFELRHENDVLGLGWIHRFGWLRSAELGRLMWPNDKHARTRADRVIRGWLDRKLVIERQLPDGARRAVVLSEAGARFLQDLGSGGARSGKDWGETDGERWHPNLAWQHDLVATGVLVYLFEDGYDIVPEKTLRRDNPGLVKIPDGLAWNSEQVIWLEVEKARKTGKAMHELAAAICVVAEGTCQVLSGQRPTIAMIAFIQGGKDERGLHINHRSRVSMAIQQTAKKDVALLWAQRQLAGCGVANVTIQSAQIPADRATRILQKLDAGGWIEDADGCLVAHYGGVTATIWHDEDMGWSYQLEGACVPAAAFQADNKTEAKRGCANLLAKA